MIINLLLDCHHVTGSGSYLAALPSLGTSLEAQLVKNLPAMRKTWIWSQGSEDPLEKEKATHSSILLRFFFFFFWVVCVLYIFNWGIIPLLFYVGPRCTMQWFAISTHYKVSLVAIYHHSYHNIIDYIPYAVYFICITHLLCNYKFLPSNPFFLLCPNTYTPLLWQPPASFLYLRVCFSLVSFVLFFRFYISEIIWYLSFSVWLISLSLIPTGSIHVITNDKTLFFFMVEKYSTDPINHIFFIHPSIAGHLGSFHIMATINNAAMNIWMNVSFKLIFFYSSEKYP